MELLEKYFAELIQCVDASYLVIGIILVFLSVPDTADYAPYRKAKYFLASAFFVMFINLYLWLEIFSSQDCIIAKTICTNFQNEMCKNRHFFAVCLPVLEYHLKGF